MRPARRDLLKAAGACSLVAGLIHIVNAPEHLAEWWGYGLFFLFASMAQLAFAGALFVVARTGNPAADAEPPRETWAGSGGAFVTFGLQPAAYFRLGIGGNAAIVALYVVTRTVGIPFFGPDAGSIEPVTVLGVASKVAELAVIACLVLVLRGAPAPAPGASAAPARP